MNATALLLERAEPRTGVPEWRRYIRAYVRSASSVAGLVIVALFLLVSAIGPWIVPYPEDARGAVHLDQKLQPPSRAHWFGTDEVGNDVYTRVVLGARVSLQIGLIITVLAALLGVPLGIVAGYAGGALGETSMRVTDIFLSVPALVLALAVVGALGPGILNAMLALALVWWPGYVRLVQGRSEEHTSELQSHRDLPSFPTRRSSDLVLALAVVGALGPGILNAMLALALVWWPGYVRLVQG